MKTSLESIFIAVAVLGLSAPSTALSQQSTAVVTETRAALDQMSDQDALTIARGMSEEQVIGIVGKPWKVKKMKTVQGSAERWIYRRVLDETVVQDGASTQEVPAVVSFGDQGAIMGTRTKIVYHMKRVTTYQITELLMFEGQLVMAKQRQEVEERFSS